MIKFLLILFFAVVTYFALISLWDTTFVSAQHTFTLGKKTVDVSFDVPSFPSWKPGMIDESYDSIVVEYRLAKSSFNDHDLASARNLSISLSERTEPFNFSELERTKTLRSGQVRYSVPAVDESGEYATMLITVVGMPGYYTIRSPINFHEHCQSLYPRKIVATVLGSLSASDDRRVQSKVEKMVRLWYTGRHLEWPDSTIKCF